ncbi:cell division protein SepF [Haploplasma axanthum]|uniref:Cell division protein SepF n=1 Tax=Haploplasma axanthum TaxID=29552 RepID=A0A449BEG6_HAPAX|nr:cell division protein SepF [Haploplasma axanthum]VEU80826.1 Cell division protein SepF [Haploplasma axanthum]
MGLFSFFKKKPKEEAIKKQETVELIIFEQLEDADDTHLTRLATELINGKPLVINLEQLDIDGANKVIAFLSGVIYTIEGEISNIKEKIFLFGPTDVYTDGSVRKLLENL